MEGGEGISRRTDLRDPQTQTERGDGQREGGRGWVRAGTGGRRMGTSIIVPTIKIK